MQHLDNYLNTLPCKWLTLATGSSKKNVEQLKSISEALTEKYTSYSSIVSNYRTELADSEFKENKDLLVEYYEKAPSSLNKELLNRRNEHGLYSCPFCGNPMKPDTLDHFIPKDKWPEFSIFSNNLVPQCRSCAPIKGEEYYCNDNKQAKFIHPIYFDLLQRFSYKISVEFNNSINEPIFSVVLNSNQDADTEERQRVLLHIKSLKIKLRIIKYCKDEYRRWQTKLTKTRFDLKGALKLRLSEVPENDRGKDWKSAFCKGLLDNPSAINHLHSLRPNVPTEPEMKIVIELEIE